MKNVLLIFVALFVVGFTLPAMAERPAVPADGLKMDKSKKHVVFNHTKHSAIDCASCHHPVEGKEDYRKCSTAGCHDDFKAKKGTKSYYYVMHAKKGTKYDTCVSCHVKEAAKKPDDKDYKKAMTGCAKGGYCHGS